MSYGSLAGGYPASPYSFASTPYPPTTGMYAGASPSQGYSGGAGAASWPSAYTAPNPFAVPRAGGNSSSPAPAAAAPVAAAGGGAGSAPPLTGGGSLSQAATEEYPVQPNMYGFEKVPAEYFTYYTYRSVRVGFVAVVLFILACFLITIGAIANILVDGCGFKKWGWAIMWGIGILIFIVALGLLWVAWNVAPQFLKGHGNVTKEEGTFARGQAYATNLGGVSSGGASQDPFSGGGVGGIGSGVGSGYAPNPLSPPPLAGKG